MTVPFRADIVGSFLRTSDLKAAREKFKNNNITSAELKLVEDVEIKKLVEKQIVHGLKVVTDGDFRRSDWWISFINEFKNVKIFVKPPPTVAFEMEVAGKIEFNPENPVFSSFAYLKSIVPAGITPKVCCPSPAHFLYLYPLSSDKNVVPPFYKNNKSEFFTDLSNAYKQTVQKLYDLGLRYLQIDDCVFGRALTEEERDPTGAFPDDIAAINNLSLTGLPADLKLTMHICRGNFLSRFFGKGAYDPVASSVAKVNVDGYFLEYDDERSGDFRPLEIIKENKKENQRVVLGIVTSKFPKLEKEEELIARIEEASKYFPKDRLAISTQCGFASIEAGNIMTEDEQWAKIDLVVSVAKKVWGDD